MRYQGRGTVVSKYKGNALFYKLKIKLPLSEIQAIFLSEKETPEQLVQHWEIESHWLADWKKESMTLYESITDGDEVEVEFEIKSTSYSPDMKHNGISIGPFRNLNVTLVKKV